jgi:hypothetical protein
MLARCDVKGCDAEQGYEQHEANLSGPLGGLCGTLPDGWGRYRIKEPDTESDRYASYDLCPTCAAKGDAGELTVDDMESRPWPW